MKQSRTNIPLIFLVFAIQLVASLTAHSQLLDPYPSSADPLAGSLPAVFDVDERGDANYTIRLRVPPGTAGMAPEISLRYGGEQMRGILGPRWSLIGISAISRCSANMGNDGFTDPVDFDGNDKYCLDGQRLVSTQGGYGANGTLYRTATDTFSRITSYGVAGDGPDRWTVEYRDGRVAEFGLTINSRSHAAGSGAPALSWLVSSVRDRAGNSYSVQYQHDSVAGEVIPLRIDYTANVGTGLTPYNSVRFEYLIDPLEQQGYIGNSPFWSRRHLSAIKMYSGDTLAWQYNMLWQWFADTQREQLIGVEECGASGQCLPATTFTWNTSSAQPSFQPIVSANILGTSSFAGFPLITGDWNGDGKVDIGRASGHQVELYTTTATGWSFYNTVTLGQPPSSPNYYPARHPIFALDFNGDGFTDLARLDKENVRLYRMELGGNVTLAASLDIDLSIDNYQRVQVVLGDFNGDGRADFAIPANGIGSRMSIYGFDPTWGDYRYFNGTGPAGCNDSSRCPVIAGDWNGDGMTDLAEVGTWGVTFYVARNNPAYGFQMDACNTLSDLGIVQGYGTPEVHPFFAGDFNGDGMTDIARIGQAGIRFYRSYGGCNFGGAQDSPYFGVSSGYANVWDSPLLLADFNRDGMTDVGRIGNGLTQIYLAHKLDNIPLANPFTLNDFAGPAYIPGDMYPLSVADFNGDGSPDIARMYGATLKLYQRTTNRAGLIERIRDGIGAETRIFYKPMTDSTVYTKGSGASYPNVELQTNSMLVSRTEAWDSAGTMSSIDYRYAGLRGTLDGAGEAEFEYIDETTNEGVRTRTLYSHSGDFRGLPLRVEVSAPNGQLLSRKVDTWAKHNPTPQSVFPYIATSIEENWDPTGALLSTTTTTSTYDVTSGSLLTESITRGDGSTQQSTISVSNNTAAWLLGQLTQTVVTRRNTANDTPISRTVGFTYNSLGQLLSEVIEPSSTIFQEAKAYSYDAYGNITSITHSASQATSRTESKGYDASGRFPTSVTDALGGVQTFEYDPRHGGMIRHVDLNGLVTETTYDDFGRAILRRTPEGLVSRTLTRQTNSSHGVPGSSYYQRIDTPAHPPSFTFYDSFGREVMRQITGFDGREIIVERAYDTRGHLTHVSEPHFAGDTALWSVYDYDILGRIVSETLPGSRTTLTIYNGLTTSTLNPLNQTSSRTTDQQGRLVASVDHYGQSTSYRYDAFGSLTETRDAANNLIVVQYDIRGRRTHILDPNSGAIQFTYDGFGQTLSQTDARNITISYTYDALGRMVQRASPDGVEQWVYDAVLRGRGKLSEVIGIGGYRESYGYDHYGRLASTLTIISGQRFKQTQQYDSQGRLVSLTYPSGFTIGRSYNVAGYLERITRTDTNQELWRALTMNARRQLESQRYGNNLTTLRGYEPDTGLLLSTQTGTIQDLTFVFDAIGNLTRREDRRIQAIENFQYDSLNRLVASQVVLSGSPYPMTTVSYDAIGNITFRSDTGAYLYGQNGSGPHAVTSVTGARPALYGYDASGNRVSDSNGTAAYNSFGKVVSLTKGASRLDFTLDPDGQRAEERIYKGTTLVEAKAYVGRSFERVVRGTSVDEIHFITADDSLIAIHSQKRTLPQSAVVSAMRYVHTDHLGSIQSLSDETGTLSETMSFSAWGERRDPLTWSTILPRFKGSTDRGFTGHEHLDEVGLIHMNGRVYDPVVGRFLSVDPIVQSPENMQSLNRYSYVLNNPLSLVDPSGYFSLKKFWKKALRFTRTAIKIGVVVGASFYTGFALQAAWGTGFWATISNGLVTSMVSSVTSAAVHGGTLSSGLRGGLRGAPIHIATTAATFGIGQAFKSGSEFARRLGQYTNAARAATHAVAGGLSSAASGGKFLHGAVGAFAGGITESAGNPLLTALTSGTAAALSGGKFQEGAIRGAFVYLYNRNTSWDPRAENADRVAFGEHQSSSFGILDFARDLSLALRPLADEFCSVKKGNNTGRKIAEVAVGMGAESALLAGAITYSKRALIPLSALCINATPVGPDHISVRATRILWGTIREPTNYHGWGSADWKSGVPNQ